MIRHPLARCVTQSGVKPTSHVTTTEQPPWPPNQQSVVGKQTAGRTEEERPRTHNIGHRHTHSLGQKMRGPRHTMQDILLTY